jgi:hypothetical protein
MGKLWADIEYGGGGGKRKTTPEKRINSNMFVTKQARNSSDTWLQSLNLT